MHAFVSTLLAGLLFIQAVTGWCWQRPRACLQCDECSTQATRVAKCCDHDGRDEQQRQPSQGPCRHKVLCRGCCNYLPPEKTQIDASDWDYSLDLVAIPAADGCKLTACCWEACGPSDLKPPLRLHLYHQVLLI